MWPSKKKEKKGIILAPGESMEINFLTSWRRDRNEVVILTDNGPIVLNEKNELFIEVKADNIDPIKVQVIPDFKNRTINIVEIIDPDFKQKFSTNGPRLEFSGGVIKERGMSFGDILKHMDKNIKEYDRIIKRSKWTRNIFIPLNFILVLWNLYLFIKSDMKSYLNILAMAISLFVIYYIYISHKKIYKSYVQYKDLRDKGFEIVKDT